MSSAPPESADKTAKDSFARLDKWTIAYLRKETPAFAQHVLDDLKEGKLKFVEN